MYQPDSQGHQILLRNQEYWLIPPILPWLIQWEIQHKGLHPDQFLLPACNMDWSHFNFILSFFCMCVYMKHMMKDLIGQQEQVVDGSEHELGISIT